MEVKALVEQQGIIKFNREEIEESLKRIEEKYRNLVFTEEEVSSAKKERTKLNNLSKDLATYRKNIVAEVTAPLKTFEDFMKEAEKRTEVLSKNIGIQIETFEEKEKQERVLKVKNYVVKKMEDNQKYKEFVNMFIYTDSIYTNKGSYTATGNIGIKLAEHITNIFKQMDEILIGREAEEKLLDEKRKLVISTCKSISELLNLEISLDPKNFTYLENSTLEEISEEIKESGNRAKKQQDEKLEEIKKREYEKAQQELEKEEVVVVKKV
ncbi:MAG: DUF1351 domain-containing protein, partial [Carnobacterium sp.]